MKTKVAFIILILVCLALGAALISRSKQAADQQKKDTETILYHSNQWLETSGKLEEQKQVNLKLENDILKKAAVILGTKPQPTDER